MKLEDQVVSLELSKKLKTLGVKQESLFSWIYDPDTGVPTLIDRWSKDGMFFIASAFTVAELGKMLPDYTQKLGNLEIGKCDTDHMTMEVKEKRWWNVSYWTWGNKNTKSGDIYLEKVSKHLQQANTEANARAKMLIYLLENDLLK